MKADNWQVAKPTDWACARDFHEKWRLATLVECERKSHGIWLELKNGQKRPYVMRCQK